MTKRVLNVVNPPDLSAYRGFGYRPSMLFCIISISDATDQHLGFHSDTQYPIKYFIFITFTGCSQRPDLRKNVSVDLYLTHL